MSYKVLLFFDFAFFYGKSADSVKYMNVLDGAKTLVSFDLQNLAAVIEIEFLFAHHGERGDFGKRVNRLGGSVADIKIFFVDKNPVARKFFLALEFDAFAE